MHYTCSYNHATLHTHTTHHYSCNENLAVGHNYVTSIKNHFYKMKSDIYIGMADYEKLVKQEFYTHTLEMIYYTCFTHFFTGQAP